METLTALFGHVCGQNHCFAAGGTPLPVCQRCLGLYAAAALTAAWLAASGIWRRGLGSWGVFLLNEATLLAAMLAGVGLWGDTPFWKVTAGAWTGHVVMLWLVGGAGHLWRLARSRPRPQRPWRTADKVQALAAPALLAAGAGATGAALGLGWHVWTGVVIAGAVLLAAAVAAAPLAMLTYLRRALLNRRAAGRTPTGAETNAV